MKPPYGINPQTVFVAVLPPADLVMPLPPGERPPTPPAKLDLRFAGFPWFSAVFDYCTLAILYFISRFGRILRILIAFLWYKYV